LGSRESETLDLVINISSSYSSLGQEERNQVLAVWNQHVKNTVDTGDPFKYALYKLIGRIEVDRKNVRYVIATMEDWMWYQLGMVREEQSSTGRTYTLADLGKKVLEFGPSHFISEATQNNPLVYVQNLFYTGQFEEVSDFYRKGGAIGTLILPVSLTIAY
jgi:nuclear pore complex protein Nup93